MCNKIETDEKTCCIVSSHVHCTVCAFQIVVLFLHVHVPSKSVDIYRLYKLNRLNSDRIENTSVCHVETCIYTLYHVVMHAIHFKMHERCHPMERHQKKNARTQTNQKNHLKCELNVTPPPLVVLRRVPCVDLVSTFGRSRGRSHAMFIYGILMVYQSDIHGSFRSACTAHLPSFWRRIAEKISRK